MKLSTEDYLKHKNIYPETALRFSCNDYTFLTQHGYESIIINSNRFSIVDERSLEETLTKEDIVNRIKDLCDVVDRTDKTGTLGSWVDDIRISIIVPELRELIISSILVETVVVVDPQNILVFL
jgi:hypothetical protein